METVDSATTGLIRVCVDMVEPNRATKRTRHIIPTVEELRVDLNGARVFFKLQSLDKVLGQLCILRASASPSPHFKLKISVLLNHNVHTSALKDFNIQMGNVFF